jgi:hypothetical protein
MSLVTMASPWNDENSTKKRSSTMRRTVKIKPITNNLGNEPDEYVSNTGNFLQPATIEDTQTIMNERNDKVNDLLNKITSIENQENTGKMGNFVPLPNPNIQVKKDMTDNTETGEYTSTIPNLPSFHNALNVQKGGVYSPNNIPASVYSNYRMSYDNPLLFNKIPQKNGNTQGNAHMVDNKILEKINYLIHLMEEQQMEKTSNITEEFILYTFLGVFIIFVVDSFARSGKYTR